MRRALALLGSLALALGAFLPAGAFAADAPWEQEVERATEAQDREIEAAKRAKSMVPVVSKYGSRLSRESSAFNHYLLGRALYYNEDPVGAKAQMTAAIEVDPGFWPAHLRLAKLLVDLKSPAAADRHLQAVLARKPGHPDALRLSTTVAIEAKDWARALRLLEELVRRFPDDLGVRHYLVSVHLQRKDWDAAIAQLRLLQARDPGDADVTLRLAHCHFEKKDLDAATREYQRYAAAKPSDPRAWMRIYEIHMGRREWEKARTALERLIPLLPADRQPEASKTLEALRTDPEALVASAASPEAASRPTWPDVFAKVQGNDAEARADALRTILAAVDAGALDRVPAEVLTHVVKPTEDDWRCRALVVKILARLGKSGLPLLGVALHDDSEKVRMLAAEAIGDVGYLSGVAYLLPRLDGVDDPAEFQAVRAALSQLTGHQDLPSGASVVRPEDVDASREAWRRWGLSDASRKPKMDAVQEFLTLPEPLPERYLVDFVADPTFDVMRAAYLGLRRAVGRTPTDPVSVKMLPRFPRFSDEEVTRASMRSVQGRVKAWWDEWHAERRALMKAGN